MSFLETLENSRKRASKAHDITARSIHQQLDSLRHSSHPELPSVVSLNLILDHNPTETFCMPNPPLCPPVPAQTVTNPNPPSHTPSNSAQNATQRPTAAAPAKNPTGRSTNGLAAAKQIPLNQPQAP